MSIEVRESRIHGKGVFARRPFEEGEWIGRYVGPRTAQDDTYVLWVEDGGEWKGYNGVGKLRFLNHQSRPNSEFDGIELYALTAITPGDEITFHYGEEWEDVD